MGNGTTLPDPPRRSDNRCALPGCSKPLVEITARHRKYGGEAVAMDPWCSSRCCRIYHGLGDLNEQANQSRKELCAENRSSSYTPNNTKHGTRESYELCACELCTAAVKGAA